MATMQKQVDTLTDSRVTLQTGLTHQAETSQQLASKQLRLTVALSKQRRQLEAVQKNAALIEARAALEALTPDLLLNHPWIRQIADIEGKVF